MKRVEVCIALAVLLSIIFSLTSQAQSTINISQNQIVSEFPNQLIFQLSSTSQAKIQEVKLLYHTNGANCQTSIAQQDAEFTPGLSVDAQWTWDFTLSGVLPPGAEVSWQWEINDESGNSTLTEEQTYLVNDTRQDWKTRESGQVTLQWYEGSSSFGQSLLDIANQSLNRMANNAGVRPTGQVWLTIYPTAEELLEVDIHASEWAGGIAYPEYNSSIIAIAPDDLSWARSVIPHELAHLVTDAAVFNCQGLWLPTWLSEGLAVYAEGKTTSDDHDAVIVALDNNDLPPLRTLASGFSSNSSEANLSYAQSGMVVTYMIDTYGAQQMSDLLDTIQSGNKIDPALMQVYEKDTDGIEADWRISLGYAAQPTLVPTSAIHTAVPTLALWTSAVKPSVSPTLLQVVTATPVPFPATTLPAASPTQADRTSTPDVSSAVSSGSIKNAYVVVIAVVTVILAVIAILILFFVTRRRKNNP